MKKSILITGISGSGKSAVAIELKKRGYISHSIEEIDGLFYMINKRTGDINIYDNKKFVMINKRTGKINTCDNEDLNLIKEQDWVCNKDKLQKLIEDDIEEIVFYCGNASNLNDIIPLFDTIFVLSISEETLHKRLTNRTSNDFGRTLEVQKWICSWKQWREDHMIEKGVIIIDGNQEIEKVVDDIIKYLL